MIVEPDFLDHWKTRLLVSLTKDESAPLMVLRLWAHCQCRRKWKFENISGEALAAICRSQMEPMRLQEVFFQCGFLTQDNGLLCVHDWDVSNRMLISAWRNGLKGGRIPRTDRIPTGNRRVARRQPTGNRSHLSSLSYLSVLKEERVRERFKEWIEVRKAQGKKPKDWDKMFAEQCKWLSQFNAVDQLESISASIRNNWQGLFPPKHGKNDAQPVKRDPRDEKLEREMEETRQRLRAKGVIK